MPHEALAQPLDCPHCGEENEAVEVVDQDDDGVTLIETLRCACCKGLWSNKYLYVGTEVLERTK